MLLVYSADESQVWAFAFYVSKIVSSVGAAQVAADMMQWIGGWGGSNAKSDGDKDGSASESTTRLAWAMVPFVAKKLQAGKPTWLSLRATDGSGTEPFSLLVSLTARPVKGCGDRPERLQYTLGR